MDTQVSQAPCLSCKFCTDTHYGRAKPASTCTPWIAVVQDPRNPPEYRWEKRPLSLYNILRTNTPKALWKERLKTLRAPRPKASRPKWAPPTAVPPKRLSKPRAPWREVRRGLKQLRAKIKLQTPSPRIVTIATHGPGSLLRPFFPEYPDLPRLTITPEVAQRLARQEKASRLAGLANLALGGHGNTISELEALKAPEPSKAMEETEPLRAMALREVTNIRFLKDYTATEETEGTEGTEEE